MGIVKMLKNLAITRSKRTIALGCMAMGVVTFAILLGGSKSEEGNANSMPVKVEGGREIKAFVMDKPMSSGKSSYAEAKAYIRGTDLVIVLLEGQEWIFSCSFFPLPLTIRCFDKNGNYLGHFKTKEQFIPEWAYNYSDPKDYLNLVATRFFNESKSFTYPINARDADYVGLVELSFSELDFLNNWIGSSYSKNSIEEKMTNPREFLGIINPSLIDYVKLSPEDNKYVSKISDKDVLRKLTQGLRMCGGGISIRIARKVQETGKEIIFHLINGQELTYKISAFSEGSGSGVFYPGDNGATNDNEYTGNGDILDLFKIDKKP